MSTKKPVFRYKSANEATGFLLWKTHNLWQREIRKSLKKYQLTHTQFVVLANAQWLISEQGKVTQVEIAKHAQIDVMMTSNVIRALEKKNLLGRKEHETDTRAKLVFLTKTGLSTLKKSVKEVESFDYKFFGALKSTSSFNKELLRLLDHE